MADKWMYIPNDDSQNYPFCRLQLVVESFYTQLGKPTNQNLLKVPKVNKVHKMFIKLWVPV